MLITVALLIGCALIAVVAVPLLLKLVPPNPIYGVRTEKTLDSSETWYKVNIYGGKALLIAAGVAALLLMVYSGTYLRPWWAQLVVFVVAMLGAVGATLYYERKQ
jgi:uncharacterized membrane protein